MGGINVKNTIVERVLQNIAPHHCYSCGKVGILLCPRCKDDIMHEPFVGCFLCGRASRGGVCENHESPIARTFIVSQREGVLRAIIDALKFHHTKAAAKELALLLHERLPVLPNKTILVPIPTVSSHIRQRGYDQVELIAQELALLRHLPIQRLLGRTGRATLHTLNRSDRHQAAQQAFEALADEAMPEDTIILLLDDIVTTGATLQSAARVLRPLGVPIWMAAIAYQPLD